MRGKLSGPFCCVYIMALVAFTLSGSFHLHHNGHEACFHLNHIQASAMMMFVCLEMGVFWAFLRLVHNVILEPFYTIPVMDG